MLRYRDVLSVQRLVRLMLLALMRLLPDCISSAQRVSVFVPLLCKTAPISRCHTAAWHAYCFNADAHFGPVSLTPLNFTQQSDCYDKAVLLAVVQAVVLVFQ